MANSISINEAELNQIKSKLDKEKASLSEEDAALLKAVLAKGEAEKKAQGGNGNWAFNWTYHF